MPKRASMILVALLITAFIGGSIISNAVSQDGGEPVEGTPDTLKDVAPVNAKHKKLSVFRRAITAEDRIELPAQAADAIQSTGKSPQGVNPGQARKAYVTPAGGTYHLMPAADDTVAVQSGGGGSMDSVDHILTGESVEWQMCGKGIKPDELRVAGVVPDEVKQVTVKFRDGKTKNVTVKDNVWAVEVKRKPTTVLPTVVTMQISGTTKNVDLRVPDDIATGSCMTQLPPPNASAGE